MNLFNAHALEPFFFPSSLYHFESNLRSSQGINFLHKLFSHAFFGSVLSSFFYVQEPREIVWLKRAYQSNEMQPKVQMICCLRLETTDSKYTLTQTHFLNSKIQANNTTINFIADNKTTLKITITCSNRSNKFHRNWDDFTNLRFETETILNFLTILQFYRIETIWLAHLTRLIFSL